MATSSDIRLWPPDNDQELPELMRTDDLDFHLPPELIAQTPSPDRAASRLLHYRRADRTIAHQKFFQLPTLLCRGDLLVFNDAKVIPARFALRKETGGLVDGQYLGGEPSGAWVVLLRNIGPDAVGKRLHFN